MASELETFRLWQQLARHTVLLGAFLVIVIISTANIVFIARCGPTGDSGRGCSQSSYWKQLVLLPPVLTKLAIWCSRQLRAAWLALAHMYTHTQKLIALVTKGTTKLKHVLQPLYIKLFAHAP